MDDIVFCGDPKDARKDWATRPLRAVVIEYINLGASAVVFALDEDGREWAFETWERVA